MENITMSMSQRYLNKNVEEHSFSVRELAEKLERGCEEVSFAYIFGSSSDGIVNSGSDLDLAFYLTCDVSLHFYSKVTEIVESIVPDVRIDIGILNNTEPVFRYEVLKGRLLFSRDQESYLRFYSLTCRLYESQIFDYEKQHKYRMEVLNG
jgi:predicted nucleotidyltransferase